jgi:Flp pilus assembly protein TadD
VFLLLAVVFAGGFIFFGVGTGNSGLGDIFTGGGSLFGGGGESISELREKVAKNPSDAESHLKLARELRSDERPEEAIDPMERYTQLRPKDAGALQELATLYLERARRQFTELNAIEGELATIPGGAGFEVPPGSFLAKEQQNDPFYKTLQADLTRRRTEVIAQLNATLSARADAYKRAVAALPADDTSLPGTVFAWARAAEDAQDFQGALTAYRRYLKLAPDSALAADARSAIRRLEAYVKAQGGGSGG